MFKNIVTAVTSVNDFKHLADMSVTLAKQTKRNAYYIFCTYVYAEGEINGFSASMNFLNHRLFAHLLSGVNSC